MSRDTGWEKVVCDGHTPHCVKMAFIKEGDTKAKNIWHDREYITKDGQKVNFTFCDACDSAWRELIESQDKAVFAFTNDKE